MRQDYLSVGTEREVGMPGDANDMIAGTERTQEIEKTNSLKKVERNRNGRGKEQA